MVDELRDQSCVPCRGDSPRATEEEIQSYLPQIPDWEIIEQEGVNRLCRTYKFKNFMQALEFAQLIGEFAEREDHHPLLILEWGKVTVHWWTHAIKGLHKNDFVMAAKSDEAYEKK
jgi:4a-hydroxytetrahydrobiopterin dehydratase